MRPKPQIPPEIEEYRDERWRREAARQIETALEAERFIEQAGFVACLTDSTRPGPSLYVAVCGRRDAVMPRNVQKDPEASLAWVLKDEIIGRGKVYYGKLAGARAVFLAPRMIPYFHAVWGMRRAEEPRRLGKPARAILTVLRREWEMATSDLRDESGVKDRKAFNRGMCFQLLNNKTIPVRLVATVDPARRSATHESSAAPPISVIDPKAH